MKKKKVDTSRKHRQIVPLHKPREIYLIIIRERAERIQVPWDEELRNKLEGMDTEQLRLIVYGSGIE